MSGPQLYLPGGLPSFVALAGTLVIMGYFVFLNRRVIRIQNKPGIVPR